MTIDDMVHHRWLSYGDMMITISCPQEAINNVKGVDNLKYQKML